MIVTKAYLVGTKLGGYRTSEPAEVLGVVGFALDEGIEPQICYRGRFRDGTEIYVEVGDQYYELVSELDVRMGRIPPVRH